MARGKYNPLKSNTSSYFKKPRKTQSDKRSGDSVGKGLKRGTYGAWMSYHHPKKKSIWKVNTSRRVSTIRTKSSGTVRRRMSTEQLPVVRVFDYTDADSSETLTATIAVEEVAEKEETKPAFAGSKVLPPEFLQALREELAPDKLLRPEEEMNEKGAVEEDEEGPVFGSGEARNIDHCPYCGFVFEKIPKRGRSCERCGQKFVVRSQCVLYNADFFDTRGSGSERLFCANC